MYKWRNEWKVLSIISQTWRGFCTHELLLLPECSWCPKLDIALWPDNAKPSKGAVIISICKMKKHTEKDLVVYLKVTEIWQAWSRDQIPIFGTTCSLSPQELPWYCWFSPLFPLRKKSKGKVPGLSQMVEFEFEGDVLLPSVSVLCNPFDPPGSSWSTPEGVSQQVCLRKKWEPLAQVPLIWHSRSCL